MKKHQVLATLTVVILAVSNSLVASSQPSAPTPAFGIDQARSLTTTQGGEGQLWAAWEADSGPAVDLYYSRWIGGAWSSPEVVYRRPDAWDRAPSLAIAADGRPWLAWSAAEKADPDRSSLCVSRWTGQQWTVPEVVPLGNVSEATEPALAAAPDGILWLAWVGFDGVDDEIFASHWDGEAWSAPWQVSADDNDASLYDRQPRLAVGGDGHPWLVWTGHQAGVDDEIFASHWTGTRWTPEQAISDEDDALDVSPSLVLDRQGQPWVAWMGRVTDGEHSQRRILVSHWDTARSTWTPEAMVSSPVAFEGDEELPTLSSDGKGGMHLAWVASSGSDAALAYGHWQGGQWAEPRLIRAGVAANTGILLAAGERDARLLWLEPTPGSPLPFKWASAQETFGPLSDWAKRQGTAQQSLNVDPIPNRHLAFGDSITCFPGCVQSPDFAPYPVRLEETLDERVAQSEVVNAGKAAELIQGGKDRIKGQVSTYQPKYVLIMEGTNDVTDGKLPSDVKDHLKQMIYNARNSGVDDVQVMMATIIPRGVGELDLNDETQDMNDLAVIPAAQEMGAPLCNQWSIFVHTTNWEFELFYKYYRPDDWLHPNEKGLQLIANTFYNCLLDTYPELEEDSTPPVTWIESAPSSIECSPTITIPVSWNGEDNLSWLVDYDVQTKVNDAPWTDWFVHTQNTSGTYTYSNGRYGDIIAFQVRGRDVVGNQSVWSAAEDTQIADSVPPYEAHVHLLPPVQLAPFPVSWWGADACADVVAYRVQYSAGTPYTWLDWPGHPTPNTSGSFDPATPQYGQTYYFRVQAQDEALNWSSWSSPLEAYTLLAQFSLQGHFFNIRHQPVAHAQTQITPSPTWLGAQPGGFLAYIATGGDYDISASRNDLYGPLPTMFDVAVNEHVSGLQFILPPQDDAVTDGDFEAGHLAAWQVGGSTMLTLPNEAHTGQGAVRLDGTAGGSRLSQAITPALAINEPTLSFLVRLAGDGPAGTLQVELGNTGTLSPPVTYTLTVEDVAWTHIWRDLTGLVSELLTLTFVVSDGRAIILDEVRLGSASMGSYRTYLPIIYRAGRDGTDR